MKTDPSDLMYYFRNAKPWVQLTALFIIEQPYKEVLGRVLLIVLFVVAPASLVVKDAGTAPLIPNGALSVAIQGKNLNPTTPATPGAHRPAGQSRANVPPADK